MTGLSAGLLGATLVIALFDWWAVATERRSPEYVLKPLTMVLLIAAAITLEPNVPAVRGAMLVGLVLCLVGDVLLMLDRKYFIYGLGAFLLGHIAYVVALTRFGVTPMMMLPGVAVVGTNALFIGRSLVQGAGRTNRKLAVPVALYIVVISAMVVTAFGTAKPAAIVGALLFYTSDSLLGWHRFVRPIRNGRLAYMASYHLAQVGLVLSLVT